MKKNFIMLVGLASVSMTAAFAMPMFAAESYTPLAPISFTIKGDSFNCEALQAKMTQLSQKDRKSQEYLNAKQAYKNTCKTSLPEYLRGIYYGGVILAGFLAVFAIVRGGFTLLFTDSILGHSEAKGIILRALGGLVIVYSSYLLMNTINPQLGRDLNVSLEFPRFVNCREGYDPKPNEQCIKMSTLDRFLDKSFWGTQGLSIDENKKLLAEQLQKFDVALAKRHDRVLDEIADKMTQAAQKEQAALMELDSAKAARLKREAAQLQTAASVDYAKLLGSEQLKLARNETMLQSDGRIDQSKVDATLHRLTTARQEYGKAITALNASGQSTVELVDQRATDLMAANQRIAENYITAMKTGSGELNRFTGAQFNAFGDQVRSITNEKEEALTWLETLKNKHLSGSSERNAIDKKITVISNRYNNIMCNLRRNCSDNKAYCPQLPPPVGCL